MPGATSLITLLTDFGNRDYFVASMKGVILNINPQARIVDLSHQVSAHNVQEAGYLLKSCYRYFPEGTIHVAVVDPGVGTARRPLLVTTSRYLFLAPDNGLLTNVLQEELSVEVRTIENKQYRLDAEGTTFDGRDLFAPAAAWLSRGQAPGTYGPLIRAYVTVPLVEPSYSGSAITGRIVYVDRFGNLISNITPLHLKEVQAKQRRQTLTVRIAGLEIDGLVPTYAGGGKNTVHALINSNGQLEVFVKEGSAAELLKCQPGDPIEVS